MNKLKRGLIPLAVFLMLVIPTFLMFSDNATGIIAGYPYTEPFSHPNNEQAAEGSWFYSTVTTTKFACDGSGNFHIVRVWDGHGNLPPEGHFYYSYEYDLNIKNLSFTLRQDPQTAASTFFHLNDSGGNTILRFKMLVPDSNRDWSLCAWDWTTSQYDVFHNGYNGDGDNIPSVFLLTFNENNVSLNFSNAVVKRTYEFTISGNNRLNTMYDYNDTRIEDIWIYQEDYDDDHNFYIEEMTILFRALGDAGLPYDTTDLSKFGDVYASGNRVMLESSYSCPLHASEQTIIEIQRNVNCNYKLRHFCLAMGSSFFPPILNGGINDLFLQVNDIYIGQPTGYMLIGSDRYNIYWENIDVSIVDTYPLFEIKSAVDNPDFLNKWDFIFTSEDVDNDGKPEFVSHSNEQHYDGSYTVDVTYRCRNDLVYECWFEQIAPPVHEEYGYNLSVSPSVVDLYKPVEIIYTCPIEVINKLVINNGTVDVYNETIDYTGLQTGHKSYNPLTSGTHNISIWDDTNSETELYETITVNYVDYLYTVFTNPNPSKPDNYFDIYYIYDVAVYDGVITINDENYNILANTGNLSIIEDIVINVEGVYPVKLYMNVSNSLVQKASSLHTVQVDTINELYIYYRCSDCTTYTNYYDGDTILIESNRYLRFSGSHNFIGKTVYISVYNTNFYVGDVSDFEQRMKIQQSGDYIAELILETEGTRLVLTDIHFTVVGEIIPPVDEDEDFFFGVSENYFNIIVGCIICILFVGIPMLLSKTLGVDIPDILYGIFGGLGVCISAMLGYFPWAVPLTIVLIAIAIIIFNAKR